MPADALQEFSVLTVDELAEALRVSSATVRRHLALGDIRGAKLGRGPKAHRRIPASELRQLSGEDLS